MLFMTDIIFESNKGIVFERMTYKNSRCKLSVRKKETNQSLMFYRYKNVPSYQSRYLNWGNLNCCGGWTYDETYLYTAVQEEKKLYSNIVFTIVNEDYAKQYKQCNFHTEKTVSSILSKLKSELPDDCVMGFECEDKEVYERIFRSLFICKKGTLNNFYNIDDILRSYEQFGVIIDDAEKHRIRELSDVPLEYFGHDDFVYKYHQPEFGSQLIITGLLLGYPIESTVGLIERHHNFEVKQ